MFTSSTVVFELPVVLALFVNIVSLVVAVAVAKLVPLNMLFAVFVGKMVVMPAVFGVELVVAAVASIIIGACWPFIV